MSTEYENKIVAFVDILGFSQLVSSSQDNPKKVKELLEVFQTEYRDTYDTEQNNSLFGKEVTTFSDSIVISYAFTEYGSLFHILVDLYHIQVGIICKGFFIRGGIYSGNVFHNQSMVFGPAMIEAYRIESKEAKYPRILVPRKLVELAIKNPADSNNQKEEEYFLKRFLDEVNEEYYELTHFQTDEFDDDCERIYFVKEMKKLISSGLENTEIKIKEKYIWLQEKYNELFEEINNYL